MIRIVENKAKKALKDQGIKAQKNKKVRLATIKEYILREELPALIWDPIINPIVNISTTNKEALKANPSLYNNLARAKAEFNRVQLEDPS